MQRYSVIKTVYHKRSSMCVTEEYSYCVSYIKHWPTQVSTNKLQGFSQRYMQFSCVKHTMEKNVWRGYWLSDLIG